MESPSDSAFPSSPTRVATSPASPAQINKSRGREANVYDAVAGRVTLNGPISDAESASSKSKRRRRALAGRYSSRNPKLAPEEVLFRRKHAPVRYAEQDIYWTNEDLPEGGCGHLPDGGLLKSVHGYASRFYEAAAARLGPRCVVGARIIDERSMDETALLAFGILLEEACRDALGKRGDLAFTEASMESKVGVAKVPRVGISSQSIPEGAESAGEDVASQNGRGAKRRKVAKEELGQEESVPTS
ncbi:hypothetical protein MFIFM68171_04027 [Madurella fahalii]|uniref:Uncharacterized protein n=1 Tax=Madurella fahalii TaxID=1157608 RepID=A0ABQ0G7V5_9PEZI